MDTNKVLGIIVVVLVMIIIAFSVALGSANKKAKKFESLYNFQNDTIEVLINKYGEVYHQRTVLEMDYKTLKQYNDSLYEAVKIAGGKEVVYLTQIKTVIDTIRDTIYSNNTDVVETDSALIFISQYDDESIGFIYGHNYNLLTKSVNGFVTDFTAQLDFTVGLKEDDGKLKAFVTFTDKRFQPTQIDGVSLGSFKKQKTKNSIGIGVGYGMSFYDGVQFAPSITIGYQRGFINW